MDFDLNIPVLNIFTLKNVSIRISEAFFCAISDKDNSNNIALHLFLIRLLFIFYELWSLHELILISLCEWLMQASLELINCTDVKYSFFY